MTWPDYLARSVRLHGRRIMLNPQETELVLILLLRRGCTLARAVLIEMLWPNPDVEPDWADNLLSVLTYRLRRKLGDRVIETKISFGLRIPTEHELTERSLAA